MNYYEHHLGDYAKDTGHLSMLEHGAYRTLLDRYYSTEEGIPAAQAYRLARARSEEERHAVDVVLEEFFELIDGVWINGRAEKEIARASVRINTAKENGKKGGRPRRAAPNTETETQQKPSGFQLGSETETQLKAHQTPDTNHHTPGVLKRASTTEPDVARETGSGAPASPTAAGKVCRQLREAGIQGVNPSHPKLLALLDAGLTADEIAGIAREPAAAGKGFAWILAAAEGRRRDAATVRPLPRASPSGVAQQNRDAIERAKAKILASEAAREAQHIGDGTHAR